MLSCLSEGIPRVDSVQRACDLQLIRDSWRTLWSGGRKQYRVDGRGLLIILADKPPLAGQGYPIMWLTATQLRSVGDADAERMVSKYDPRKEIIVLVDHGKGGSSVYQVGKEQFTGVG
jgi:hypothetical protein